MLHTSYLRNLTIAARIKSSDGSSSSLCGLIRRFCRPNIAAFFLAIRLLKPSPLAKCLPLTLTEHK
ncbi:hypothetical protein DERP_011216 [Dermatophagoides pteronyssinus]|uniref:Uncharacterized protein n=1 Tax=Dermatophagoides pteronyssinus TaxID=6956 RepID=A0ABQ8JCX3_DERPT|nr:hypothetical protein DERP_011216 [Dermatophagoides pteronyssinus]